MQTTLWQRRGSLLSLSLSLACLLARRLGCELDLRPLALSCYAWVRVRCRRETRWWWVPDISKVVSPLGGAQNRKRLQTSAGLCCEGPGAAGLGPENSLSLSLPLSLSFAWRLYANSETAKRTGCSSLSLSLSLALRPFGIRFNKLHNHT